MILAIRKLQLNQSMLYSVLEIQSKEAIYKVMTEEELIQLYESRDKLVTASNYKVVNGSLVFKTDIGVAFSLLDALPKVRDIQVLIKLSSCNVWAAITCILFHDFTYTLLLDGEQVRIKTLRQLEDSIEINGKSVSKQADLVFTMASKALADETMHELNDCDAVIQQEEHIVLRLAYMQFTSELSTPRMKLIMSTIGPLVKIICQEYTDILTGFESAYCAYTATPDVKGDAQLVRYLRDNKLSASRAIEVIKTAEAFPEQKRMAYSKGIADFLEYCPQNSLTYSLHQYYIYHFKLSELATLQLLLCNCG